MVEGDDKPYWQSQDPEQQVPVGVGQQPASTTPASKALATRILFILLVDSYML
jgi:hypothetical protein